MTNWPTELIPYVADMGFTHIELLPITEHPFDPSWGYQPTGLYAPTSRFGDPAGFARFVDARPRPASASSSTGCRRISRPMSTGWPASTARRSMSMRIRARAFIRTGTRRSTISAAREVASFLVNNALFWLERYHVDGLRVDAVASMLYLDYSRKEASGFPTRMAAAKTSRPSPSCSA